ncbi:T6SS immunity protein Tli4 family protein [Pseudomonas sp. NPDC089743]|uniref:T6SS immunity protein Tli4 family protein n=1 Tax=Pseudomonas sp. NPDC089743 TaxID=3364471 RepID=UPI00381081F8
MKDDSTGNIELDSGYKFSFGPKYSPGDGTVPVCSAASSRAFPTTRAAFAHGDNSTLYPKVCRHGKFNNSSGYEHQNAYNDTKGRTLFTTPYSIVRISQHVKSSYGYLMTKSRTKLFAIITAITICTSAGAQSMQHHNNTFYFGRYKIEVPTDGANIWTSYEVVEERIELISKNGKRDIATNSKSTIAEITKEHKAGYAEDYDQTIPLEGGGEIIVSKNRKYNFHIYYLTKKNTLYRQKVESIPYEDFEDAVKIAKELNASIHYRNPADQPPNATFSIEAGYMKLPINKFDEKVSIGLPVSSVPGIHLTFDTQLIGNPKAGLLSRFEQQSTGVLPLFKKLVTNTTIIRKGNKNISGLEFEELLIKTRSEGKNSYAFRLEFPGTPNSSMEPYTVLELSTIDNGPGFENDQSAIDFWDKLVASLSRI